MKNRHLSANTLAAVIACATFALAGAPAHAAKRRANVRPTTPNFYKIDITSLVDATEAPRTQAQLVVKEGQSASITMDGRDIDVTPFAAGKDRVELRMEIRDDLGGFSEVVSQPKVVTVLGQTAEMAQSWESGERLHYRFTARKN